MSNASDQKKPEAVLAADQSVMGGGLVAGAPDGMQIVSVAPAAMETVHAEEITKAALDGMKDIVGQDKVELSIAYVGTVPPAYPINTIYLFASGQHEAVVGVSLKPGAPPVTEALKERLRQAAGTLSGGEQQMLAIGRCLMGAPELVMFDEPSLGLAPTIVQDVLKAIRDLNAEGLTCVLVEQNVAVSLRLASRAYVLENGRITLSGSGAELLADDRVRQAYLGM